MRVNLRRWLQGVFALFILSASSISSAAGDVDDNFRSGLIGNNKIFTSETEALTGSSFQLSVQGGVPARIKVELVDIFADETGTKQPLPLAASPFTPFGLVDFPEIAGNYQPTAQFQVFDIPFRFINIADLDRPVLGGLRITLVPLAESKVGIQLTSAIVATFAYYPIGAQDEISNSIRPKLDITSITFSRLVRDLVPFNLIPDLPLLFNKSPQSIQIVVRNVGNIFLNIDIELVVVDPRFFGRGSDTELIGIDSESIMLVPSQIGTQTLQLDNTDSADNQEIDIFPGIGIYKVITTTTGSLGAKQLTSATTTNWVVIFPWKYLLAGLILLFLLWRKFNRSSRINNSVRQNIDMADASKFTDLTNFNQEFEQIMAKHRDQVDKSKT